MPALHELLGALASQPRAPVLVVLVAGAAACDWRSRRVPNALTVGGVLAGIGLALAGVGPGPSLLASLSGCALGLALLLPLYALGTMGAGDVKLMAAVGAFIGGFDVAFAVFFTFVAGGVLALATVAWQHALPALAGTLRGALAAALTGTAPAAVPSLGRMPYAVAVCAGTLACLWIRQPFAT